MKKFLALFTGAFLLFAGVITYVHSQTAPILGNSASVVEVVVDGGHGTGFFIGDNTFITAAHVAKEAGVGESVTLRFYDPVSKKTVDVKGIVKWIDEATDTAAITATPVDGMVPADLACDLPDPAVGIRITSIGYPLYLGLTQTWGRVAGATAVRGRDKLKYLLAQISIAPGNSGGPLFDAQGRVVGLADAFPVYPSGFSLMGFPTLSLLIPRSSICHSLHSDHPAPVVKAKPATPQIPDEPTGLN